MPNTVRRYTVDEVLAFPPDGNRYELVAGELLVTPAPAPLHQIVRTRLVIQLGNYLSGYSDVATVYMGPGDVFWSDEDYVQPDILVTPAGEVVESWRECRTLLLAVEVVSPSSAQYDRVTKRRLYQRVGVTTYWVVDPDSRVVEIWRPGEDRPEIATETLRWRVVPEAEELAIDLDDVFARG